MAAGGLAGPDSRQHDPAHQHNEDQQGGEAAQVDAQVEQSAGVGERGHDRGGQKGQAVYRRAPLAWTWRLHRSFRPVDDAGEGRMYRGGTAASSGSPLISTGQRRRSRRLDPVQSDSANSARCCRWARTRTHCRKGTMPRRVPAVPVLEHFRICRTRARAVPGHMAAAVTHQPAAGRDCC
jgi:hypothetical protein